jgi:hypothetical protein
MVFLGGVDEIGDMGIALADRLQKILLEGAGFRKRRPSRKVGR